MHRFKGSTNEKIIVVTQTFKVQVEVLGAARGCTAILKCVVPSFVRELVRIISWVQEPSFYIYPTLQGDGKYHQLPSGDLLIYNVEFSDQFPKYRCKTIHRLSRQITVSDAVNVQIVEHRGIVSPVIVENSGTVVAAQDEGAALICISQGCPTPEYRWFTRADEKPSLVVPSPRVRQLGPVLAIEAVTVEDSGTYRCTASNAGGEAKADIKLIVSAPLHVEIIPPILSVHMGGNAEFKCVVSVLSGGPHFITWYKDGRQLASSGRNEVLIVNNVGREDRGMYQCVVRRAEGDTAQAAAELQLGDTPPVLTYSFIEQTLQPGPAVSLKCSAMGNPTPQIAWSLDGYPLPSNGRFINGQYVTVHGDVISHVNISHVMVEDGGEYTCTAESRAGKSSHSARLNVYGMPYIRLIPKVAAVAGETLQLKCPVAGYPIEEIHWERSGRELPDDMRQKILPDGVLQISRVEKKADTGVYTCWARNKQGHSARRSGEVTVIVPPIIEPFSFQDGLSEGMRTRTVCGVSSGDQPLVVSWLKDGQPLTPSLGANVSALDPYSSLLSISSLDSQHTGDFTCVASNPAAEVRYTAKLQVKVPPKWSVEPFDVSVERNRNVALHCQAHGVPAPTVTWKKATGSKSGEYQEIRGHMYTKLLENGTLLLQHVKEDREGFYLCQAENGIGPGIGKVIHLRVNSSPYFSAPSRLVTAKKGETATLYCAVNGDKPINVIWLRGEKVELNPLSNYRIHTKQNVTMEGVAAELQIFDVETADSGAYFCQASNLYGKDQQLVQLLVQEPPLSPQNVEAALISSRSVHLKWQHKSGDANEVYKFTVEYREHDRPWQQLELSDLPLQFAAMVEDLKPATRYSFRVIAEGPAGKSAPSGELLLRTIPQKPAGAPLNLSVLPLSSTELLVTWAPPLAELRNGEIQGFNIGYRVVDMGTYNFTSVNGDGEESGDEVILGGLAKFMRYSVVVQAFNEVGAGPLSEPIFNEVGAGPLSEPISAQTMEDVPSMPPEDVRCAAITSQSLQIRYKLMYEPVPNENYKGNDDLEIRQTTALTTVITGLRKFTNYSLQILAFTKIGDGAISTLAYCQTEEDVPGAPADIKVIIASPQSFIVSWIPPLEPNGIITRYSLYKRSMDGRQEIEHAKQSISGQQTAYEAKGVQPGVEYQFWVTASTKVGEGQSSKVVTQVASTRVVAKILPFGGTVVRPWRESITLSCASVGLPKQEWQRDDQILKGGTSRKIMDSGDLILNNLQLSDSGNYSCQVDNGYGSDKPGNDGGAPISGYSLNYRKEHGSLEEIHLSRHAMSYELRVCIYTRFPTTFALNCHISDFQMFLIFANSLNKYEDVLEAFVSNSYY
ncbi:Immunoglobulin I-set domain [Popillia japonica]|uniref:Immunoglobulin I-set domain n=1 Tax=Popillia japonica TaxID=7064 RepID=A0AAW1N209_POPJA